MRTCAIALLFCADVCPGLRTRNGAATASTPVQATRGSDAPQAVEDLPTRDQVVDAMNGARSGVAACTKESGVVGVAFAFDSDGTQTEAAEVSLECQYCRVPRGALAKDVIRCVEHAVESIRITP